MSSENLPSNYCNDEEFDWTKYLKTRCAEEVPEDFFYHVCKSEQNGIELGSILEVENEDDCGYWFANVVLSKGILVCLRYYGDESDTNDFWILVKSPRLHYLNWGGENGKKLVPPHPDRFRRINHKLMMNKVQDSEYLVSKNVLQLEGAAIYNIFKPGMYVEIQDKDYPYRVWVSKILKNVGGRLLLEMQGNLSPEKKPFWMFYLNERVFPMGWADQKGLPWRVINSNVELNDTTDSSVLFNILKPTAPKPHNYKIGQVFEVLNPYSLMVFHAGKVAKTYDNRYFKVEVDNDPDVDKRFTFVATKENPLLFKAGWARTHNFMVKPPSNWESKKPFSWSQYIENLDCDIADIDNKCRRNIDGIKVGMKFEAVDPMNSDKIRIATVKGFADHWIYFTFDRSNWHQQVLQVRSVYSDEIFPIGWCKKHKYKLNTPKSLYCDNETYNNYYYDSDYEIDFDNKTENHESKYPYFKESDIVYHYKNYKEFIECNISLERVPTNATPEVGSSSIAPQGVIIKTEVPDSDDTEYENIVHFDDSVMMQEPPNMPTNYKTTCESKVVSNMSKNICIYFNKDCYPGNNIQKSKIPKIPHIIGPGSPCKVLQQAIGIFVNLDYNPWVALRKIKNIQHLICGDLEGVKMKITSKETKSHSRHSEYLLLPDNNKMVQMYCATLCNMSGMCEYFMTTNKNRCPHGCTLQASQLIIKLNKKKSQTSIDEGAEITKKINEKIAKAAKVELDWSNKSLVERYKYYMACIFNYEAHLMTLHRSFTQLELAILIECEAKKEYLKAMDLTNSCNNPKPFFKLNTDENYFHAWKFSFEKNYRQDPRFKNTNIDIGRIEVIKVTSNPKYWSPEDVYRYLSHDPYCKDIGQTLIDMQVDGVAFMLLNEEQLLKRIQCSINLALRIMCHVAEAKFVLLKEYQNL
ncbi:uncharacterized protein LOC126842903 [Adelges cooleyi]|uniref:uncharacterized protein LOC126842903 n=1 Tax=Adelges cooleyi TaxID=133065 RepID=UPI00217FACDE|nr:uncharacterized protein LOC126842903 [Adelges cooleyi]